MIWLFLLFVLIIGGIFLLKNYKPKMPVEWLRYEPYFKAKINQFVVGINQESSRINVFEEIKKQFEAGKDVDVFVKPEPFNKYDSLAIVVTDGNGRRLGYLKRDQYRLLRTLYDNPKTLVKVVNILSIVNPSDGYVDRVVELEMYVGYPENELKNLLDSMK